MVLCPSLLILPIIRGPLFIVMLDFITVNAQVIGLLGILRLLVMSRERFCGMTHAILRRAESRLLGRHVFILTVEKMRKVNGYFRGFGYIRSQEATEF